MTKAKTVIELEAELKIARENSEVEQLRNQINQDQATIAALKKRVRRAEFQVTYTGKLMSDVTKTVNNRNFQQALENFEAELAEG